MSAVSPRQRPVFAPHDPEWLRLKREIEYRRDKSRDALEHQGVDERAADVHRGRIALAKELLQLEQQPQADETAGG